MSQHEKTCAACGAQNPADYLFCFHCRGLSDAGRQADDELRFPAALLEPTGLVLGPLKKTKSKVKKKSKKKSKKR